MKRVAIIFLLVSAIMIAGFLVFRSKVDDFLFDADKFASCFRTEAVAKYQAERLRNGNDLLVLGTDEYLGPGLESLAHSIAKNVVRVGIKSTIEQERETYVGLMRARLVASSKTEKLAPMETDEIIAKVTTECLERQKRF